MFNPQIVITMTESMQLAEIVSERKGLVRSFSFTTFLQIAAV